ncbi:MAG: hypothetical protein ACI4L5_04720 [Negativibacillus sp.]
MSPRIFVDADGCPVVDETIRLGKNTEFRLHWWRIQLTNWKGKEL